MNAGLLLLTFASVHEFAWQFAAVGTRGAVRDVTQWGLICSLCWVIHCFARQRLISAVCAAIAVMSSTTALCAAHWMAARWEIVKGVDGCSAQWGVPMMLISATAALAVFFFGPSNGNRG